MSTYMLTYMLAPTAPICANNVLRALERAQEVRKLPCALKSSLKYIEVICRIGSGHLSRRFHPNQIIQILPVPLSRSSEAFSCALARNTETRSTQLREFQIL
jgi:hypothetical protein